MYVVILSVFQALREKQQGTGGGTAEAEGKEKKFTGRNTHRRVDLFINGNPPSVCACEGAV